MRERSFPDPAGWLRTINRCLEILLAGRGGLRSLIRIMVGLICGWFVYVPVHELLHVAGCLLGGGTVTTLQIQPLYGGTILESIFSFVEAGGDYAGRLSDFDTGESDWVYALTVASPLILAVPAFLGMVRAAAASSPFFFGFLIVPALSPLLSLTGDLLELSTLALHQVWPAVETRALVSDDLFRLLASPPQGGWTLGAAVFVAAAQILAVVMALALLCASDWLARKKGRLWTSGPGSRGPH